MDTHTRVVPPQVVAAAAATRSSGVGTKVMVAALFPAATALGNLVAVGVRGGGGDARAVARALFAAELALFLAFWALGAALPGAALDSGEAPGVYARVHPHMAFPHGPRQFDIYASRYASRDGCRYLLAAIATVSMGLQVRWTRPSPPPMRARAR